MEDLPRTTVGVHKRALPTLSKCATNCHNEAGAAECPDLATDCQCTNASFQSTFLSCVQTECPATDLDTAQQFLASLCGTSGSRRTFDLFSAPFRVGIHAGGVYSRNSCAAFPRANTFRTTFASPLAEVVALSRALSLRSAWLISFILIQPLQVLNLRQQPHLSRPTSTQSRPASATGLSSSGETSNGNSSPGQTTSPTASPLSPPNIVSSSTIPTQSLFSSSPPVSSSALLNHSSSKGNSTTSSNVSTQIQTTSTAISDIRSPTRITSSTSVSSNAITTQSLHRNGAHAGAIAAIVAVIITSILVFVLLLFLRHRRRIREGRFLRVQEQFLESGEHIVHKPTVDTAAGAQSADNKIDPKSQLVESPALNETQLKHDHAAGTNPFTDPGSGALTNLTGAAPEETVTSISSPQMRNEETMNLRLRRLEGQLQALLGLGSPPSSPPSYCSE
ncbi:hypothetical protein MSAN_00608500 [Mycena sanguinolenta]|uniref:CFEM domain-containing protein n=1 Tax=Mycena sanguinolenta TaxID=230812 RepID=A0A8H7DGZ2_9AGAR|nr:hypothetical protein MSAN_00608500 [Mycena sanguinolenta]